jgi:hypothetical protein
MAKRGKERLAPVFAAADEDDLDQLLDWCVLPKRWATTLLRLLRLLRGPHVSLTTCSQLRTA